MPNLPATSTLEDIRTLARGRLGLIIGPGVTQTGPSYLDGLAKAIAERFKVQQDGSYLEVGNRAIDKGVSIEELRGEIRGYLESKVPAPGLSSLAKISWSAVVSGTPDDFFERRLEHERNLQITKRDISVLIDPRATARSRTIPVIKPLGSVVYGQPLATITEYLLVRAQWQSTALHFLDSVRASPILIVGMAQTHWFLEDFFPHLVVHFGQRPGSIVFLEGDSILENQRIIQIVPSKCISIARGSITDVAKALAPTTRNRQTSLNFLGSPGSKIDCDISDFDDLIVSVNNCLEPRIKEEERERLLDYLFRPDLPNWDPLIHCLDFERTITSEIEYELNRYKKEIECDSVFFLRGSAATGKTMILKRVALNLAKEGAVVLWIRDYRYGDLSDQIDALFKRLSTCLGDEPLYLFVDTTLAERDLSPPTIIGVARRFRIRLLAVYSFRTSEFFLEDKPHGVPSTYWNIDNDLDDLEWTNLPEYLVRLGIQVNTREAQKAIIATQKNRQTRDTLAILYWLLPQSRPAIKDSIKNEYIALGNNESLRRFLRDSLKASPDLIRRAYAFVAVSSKHGAPLPIEILVRAIGVSYPDWIDTIRNQYGSAFGLLYGDDELDPEGESYRTRNEVVTEIIVDTINGGILSREGELEILVKLLSSCIGSNSLYSKYCTRILSPWKKLKEFSYTDGLRLYDAAIDAFGYPHRTLLHHKGIWQRKIGRHLADAIATFDKALTAEDYMPNGERTDAREYIHTSKAAAILDRVKAKEIDARKGRQDTLRELEKSRSAGFLNPKAVHLYATLTVRIIKEDRSASAVDRVVMANQAMAEVDRTLLLLRSNHMKRLLTTYNPTLLHQVRKALLFRWKDQSALDSEALELWENFRLQDGFVLATRKRLAGLLAEKNQGSKLNTTFSYWDKCRELITKVTDLEAEFAEIGANLYYAWQIRPRSRNQKKASTSLRWELLRDMSRITIGSSRYREDLFYKYIYALSSAHLMDWEGSTALFQANRQSSYNKDILFIPQDYLLDENGLVQRVQGKLTGGGTKRQYFLADKYKRDFPVNRFDRWPKGSQPIHCNIIFSFAGPQATLDDNACGVDL